MPEGNFTTGDIFIAVGDRAVGRRQLTNTATVEWSLATGGQIRASVPSGAFEAAGTMTAHLAAADPHPQYLTATEGDAAYQPKSFNLTALAGVAADVDKLPYFTGGGLADVTSFTAFMRTLLDDANQGAARGTLGLGDAATKNVGIAAGTVAAGDHNHAGVYEPALTGQAYTPSNDSTTRGFNVSTLADDLPSLLLVANTLATLIRDLAAGKKPTV